MWGDDLCIVRCLAASLAYSIDANRICECLWQIQPFVTTKHVFKNGCVSWGQRGSYVEKHCNGGKQSVAKTFPVSLAKCCRQCSCGSQCWNFHIMKAKGAYFVWMWNRQKTGKKAAKPILLLLILIMGIRHSCLKKCRITLQLFLFSRESSSLGSLCIGMLSSSSNESIKM